MNSLIQLNFLKYALLGSFASIDTWKFAINCMEDCTFYLNNFRINSPIKLDNISTPIAASG